MPQKSFWRKLVSLYRVFYEKDLTYINQFSIQTLGEKNPDIPKEKKQNEEKNEDKRRNQ